MTNLEHELAVKRRNRKRCQNNKRERKQRTCDGAEGDLVV